MTRNPKRINIKNTFSTSNPSGSNVVPNPGGGGGTVVGANLKPSIPFPGHGVVSSQVSSGNNDYLPLSWFGIPMFVSSAIRVIGNFFIPSTDVEPTALPAIANAKLVIWNKYSAAPNIESSIFSLELQPGDSITAQFDWDISNHITLNTFTDTIITYCVDIARLPDNIATSAYVSMAGFCYIDTPEALGATDPCNITSYSTEWWMGVPTP